MNLASILVLIAVGLLVCLALFLLHRQRTDAGTCCSCALSPMCGKKARKPHTPGGKGDCCGKKTAISRCQEDSEYLNSKLLVHSCCAPCSGAILEYLVQCGAKPTVFFSNSNIYPEKEYRLRLKELKRYCKSLGLKTVEDKYDHKDWLRAIRGLEKEPERGARCEKCFSFRLQRAAEYAASHGYQTLTTTLASSRWKDLEQVNRAGYLACRPYEGQLKWWPRNWRKGGLQPRRSEIIREQNFYNQSYCGCEFSK